MKGFIKFAPNNVVRIDSIISVGEAQDGTIGFYCATVRNAAYVDKEYEDNWRTVFDLHDKREEE